MSEAATGIVILIVLSVICAAVANAMVRRPVAAAAVAAPAASLLLQIANTVHLGHMDPYAPIAFVVGAFWAFLIALVAGLLFRLGRSSGKGQESI